MSGSFYEDPWEPYRCGLEMLLPELQTHAPLDLVILMLGSNDLKWHTARESTRVSWTLVDLI